MNPNLVDLEALKAILRVQLHVKNSIFFDQSTEVVGIFILFIWHTFKFSFLRQVQFFGFWAITGHPEKNNNNLKLLSMCLEQILGFVF